MFVTAEDFDLQPYNIPNLDKVEDNFASFIDREEEKRLRKLFGNMFYDAFVAGLAALPPQWEQTITPDGYDLNDLVVNGSNIYKSLTADNVALTSDVASWEVQAANRWLLLREGGAYLYYNRPQKWYGMKRLVTPLIYAMWVRYDVHRLTGMGVVASMKSENANTVGVAQTIVQAYNEYSDFAVGDCYVSDFLFPVRRLWPELENSLFGYLYINSADFDDVVASAFSDFKSYLIYSFIHPGKMNAFGL